MEPSPDHLGRQTGHVQTPHLARRGGDVGGRQTPGLGRFGASPAHVLATLVQHAGQAGPAGEVDVLIGGRRHDARRWHADEAMLVGDPQHLGTLGQRQCVRPALQGCRSYTNFARHHFQRCALRRQQPRYRSVLECLAYFSPSWTAFQADGGRDFSVIVDGVSV